MFGLDKIWGYIAGFIGLAAVVLGYGAVKKSSGKAEGKAEVNAAARETVDNQVAEREKIEKVNNNLPVSDLDAKLHKHARRND